MTDEIAETVVDAGRGDFFGIHRAEYCGRRGEVDVDRLEQAARIANIHLYHEPSVEIQHADRA